MRQHTLLLTVLLAACLGTGCRSTPDEGHAHNDDGSHPGETSLQTLSYTLYSYASELFVEFKPMVAGQTTRFAVHLTKTGERFIPYTEGEVTVSYIAGDRGIRQTASSPASPGIFRLALQPNAEGTGRLVFDIRDGQTIDRFVIDSVRVFATEAEAASAQSRTTESGSISFLKEQAWKTDFANVPVTRNTIHNVIRTGGEILSAPDDLVAVVARQSGIVRLGGEHVLEGMAVSQGQALFNVSGGEIAFENIDASREEARATLDIARSELSRKQQLRDDKLITTTEYEAARLDYEQADIRFKNLERNYGGSKAATSPINGFIRSVLVGNGDHVSMGQTLAFVMRNRSLLLKADVPLRYAETLGSVGHAHFRPANGNRLYDTRELDGKAVSVGKASHPAGHTVPIHFRMNAAEGLTPGSYAEVFLMTTPINDALTIPVSALIEEQGAFHAYVQTGGESFEKRSLTLGVNDGRTAQVLQGLREGERVVSKGAYRIKIAQAGGSIPAHGHEH